MFKEFSQTANGIIEKMTLKEKIGQLNQITITPYTGNMDKLRELIRNGGVGSIILAPLQRRVTIHRGTLTVSFIPNSSVSRLTRAALVFP
ncbi:MAG: hypothetical protein IKZ47_06155 [Clostridia bacterium]|nr:hypothetical protein [Clostridia bacterium]